MKGKAGMTTMIDTQGALKTLSRDAVSRYRTIARRATGLMGREGLRDDERDLLDALHARAIETIACLEVAAGLRADGPLTARYDIDAAAMMAIENADTFEDNLDRLEAEIH